HHHGKQPDQAELGDFHDTVSLNGQTGHQAAQTQIVRLGQGMQPGQGIRETQQAYRAGCKEQRARYEQHHGKHVAYHPSPSASAGRSRSARETKATAANAPSSANTRATSCSAVPCVSSANSSSTATPRVPNNWAATIRSEARGPRNT